LFWCSEERRAAFLRHKDQHLRYEVTARVEERKSLANRRVLAREIRDQGGLAGARFADDVHVGAAVGALDAKGAALATEVGLGKDSDSAIPLIMWN